MPRIVKKLTAHQDLKFIHGVVTVGGSLDLVKRKLFPLQTFG